MSNKALLIGINYNGMNGQLYGCINDVYDIKNLLIEKYNYLECNIKILTDDTPLKPTRNNIIEGIDWLMLDTQAGHKRFFHFSGHGTCVPDDNGDEDDGLDEVIIPIDYMTNGIIRDDELRELMVIPLPKGARLTAIIDACHSGTALDLLWNLKLNSDGKFMLEKIGKYTESMGDVVLLSGCKDNQSSADAWAEGKSTGAMTFSIVKTLKKFNYKLTCGTLMSNINICIRQLSQQSPCMSFGKYSDLGAIFYF